MHRDSEVRAKRYAAKRREATQQTAHVWLARMVEMLVRFALARMVLMSRVTLVGKQSASPFTGVTLFDQLATVSQKPWCRRRPNGEQRRTQEDWVEF